jgi:hypothetical protein
MTTHRFLGLVMLVAGLVMGYLGAWMPLTDAAAHKASITLYAKAATLCPVAIVFGLIYLVFNEKEVDEMFGDRERRQPLFWFVVVITLAAGVGLYFWIDSGLSAAGYK